MVIVCWGNLAKSANETTRIEQSIEDYIEGHDENPNAHMGPDYALGAHRLAVMLDHAPYSVRNLFVYPQSRTYKAIVDPTGNGDLATIQEAIDYVEGLGGGEIFIKNGTYTLTADITIPSNIHLTGESMDGVILDFNGGNYRVESVGTVLDYATGSFTVTTDDATVLGTGTSFQDEIDPGDYLRVDDAWYKVASITDQTHMELEGIYRGNTKTEFMSNIMTAKININLENFTIKGSAAGYGLYLYALLNSTAKNIRIINGTTGGASFWWCGDCSFQNIYTEYNGGTGILVASCQSTYFEGLSSLSNDGNGLQIQGISTVNCVVYASNSSHNNLVGFRIIGGMRCSYVNCNATCNNADGIELSSASWITISGCSADSNAENGINIVTSTHHCRIVANSVRNNLDIGIYLVGGGAAVYRNVVIGNTALYNTNAQITDSGTNNDVAHNQVA
jgi:parallel beta-helix repeat protein